MTRFVVDTSIVLHLATEGLEVSGGHELSRDRSAT
jgi:hypothetical protein